ncbi:ferritin family protein [Candidatus Margulisiibacteriota bacterium]
MSRMFTAKELIGFAVEIEKSGIAFYSEAAKKSKDTKAQELYKFLIDEEAKHQKIFQGLLAGLEKQVMSAEAMTVTEEYKSFMKALVDSAIFKKDALAKGVLKNDMAILDYALGREKDSVIFYSDMRKLVPEKDLKQLDQIIIEERSHIVKLLDIKSKLS